MATVAWSTSEYLPSEEIIKLLNTTWTTTTDGVPDKPTLIEASGTGVDNDADPVRFDLNMGDVIIARPVSPAVEIRRMFHANRIMPATSKFQRLQFMNFTVETQQAVNVWYGTINLQLINMAVPLETAWS